MVFEIRMLTGMLRFVYRQLMSKKLFSEDKVGPTTVTGQTSSSPFGSFNFWSL
jgi:hypothetical protein